MATLEFTGGFAVPGTDITRETHEDAIWRENYDANRPYYSQQTIDGASRDTGNTGQTHVLRAGLLMAKKYGSTVGDNKAASIVPWDPAGTDGSQEIWGPLLVTTNTQHLASDNDKWVSWVLTGGLIRAASIIVPGSAGPGLEGNALGIQVRESMANSGRFRFDDGPHDWQGTGYKSLETISAATTLRARDSGKAFILTGGAVVTLPPVAGTAGWKVTFYGGSGGGSVQEASGGELLPSSPQTVAANTKREVYGLDGTNFLATGAPALT